MDAIAATQAFVRLDLKLETGDENESVNVTDEVPPMETANAPTGKAIDRKKLVDLANLGPNPFIMAKIAA